MGLGRHVIEALVRESQHKPINGEGLLIGRQTVYLSPSDMLALLREHGADTAGIDPASIELDKDTINRKSGVAATNLISDAALLRLVGIRKVLALDHSAYEGADIIHDLRYPVPAELRGRADFILDGSTLDNVFTPSTVLQNYCALLRPGGRLLANNAFSAHDTSYVIMPPLWYVDYFVMNGFADCRVYVLVYEHLCLNVFYVDLREVRRLEGQMGRFHSPHYMSTIVLAEKGADSTTDRLPNQQDYRSKDDWRTYRTNLERMLESKRPHLVRSNSRQFHKDTTPGHFFIDQNFVLQP
jgi:hypothetical protein